MEFSSLAAPVVVILTTSSAARDENSSKWQHLCFNDEWMNNIIEIKTDATANQNKI